MPNMDNSEVEQIDFTKLKYVLYARKSTDDGQRQVRSIPDQIAECKDIARRHHLNVVDVLQESKSAKKPNQRPIFRQMLKDIKSGKYDAILAWNPDRLARNMLESGEIIDMIDNLIIKDLKFATHPFERTANGVMLLGMSFVLSKQYSDDLSQKVTRGVRRSFAEGKSPTPKHGYIRDDQGLYQPDGKNFDLIVEAWQMRKDNQGLEAIADYLNKSGYGRKIKGNSRIIKMTKQTLTDLFKDPFYYGILFSKTTGATVDLREIYDFTPAITQEFYNDVQTLTANKKSPFKLKTRLTFNPFRQLLICAFCKQFMYVAPSSGYKKYLYARCDNKDCIREKKSIRVKVVLDFIYKFLEDGLNLTEADYQEYYSQLKEQTDAERDITLRSIHSSEATLKSINSEIRDRSLGIVDKRLSETVVNKNQERIAELEIMKQNEEQTLSKLREKVRDPEKDRLTLEQFLNLSQRAAVIIKSANPIIKDEISKLIFLNLAVDEEKVASYQLKPPFDEMLKSRQKVSSRGQRTRTSDLTVPNRALYQLS
jgi:DNA invertase Pin-like site-specific DNA recombinase